jgi:opacity protein-like surface antigen
MQTVKLLPIALILLIVLPCQGQDHNRFSRSKEIGIAVGTSYYIGDINPTRHFGGRLNVGGGLNYRNNFDKRWALKAGFQYHNIEAYDSDSPDLWQQNRNLHFRTELMEGTIQMELNFWDYQIGNKNDRFTPYLFAGMAFTYFKPTAEFNGNVFELRTLGTEGQGVPGGPKGYRTNTVALPFGAGFKFNIISIIAISVEWGMRKTYTDHLDDVSGKYFNPIALEEINGRLSMELADRRIVKEGPFENAGTQRGDPTVKDWYNFTTFTLAFRIDKKPSSCWK